MDTHPSEPRRSDAIKNMKDALLKISEGLEARAREHDCKGIHCSTCNPMEFVELAQKAVFQNTVCMNVRRATWANNALQLFCKETGVETEGDGYDSAIADLICDLRHLADTEGVYWGEIIDRAEMHYESEFVHEDCADCPKVYGEGEDPDPPDTEEDSVNAAAPDLLAALRGMVKHCAFLASNGPGEAGAKEYADALAALKKAEGEV